MSAFSWMDLKKAHDKAQKNGLESFVFKERRLLTRFAFYLLQYLEMICKQKGAGPEDKVFSTENDKVDFFVAGQSLN
jgi:beta-xylosidase